MVSYPHPTLPHTSHLTPHISHLSPLTLFVLTQKANQNLTYQVKSLKRERTALKQDTKGLRQEIKGQS